MDEYQVYRDTARADGVPEHVIDLGWGFARPRIELSYKSDGDGSLAGTYGGHPRLPANIDRDGYPHFVASIDCAALPQDVLDFPLPRDGELLFFADKHDEEDNSDGHVIHVPAGTAAVERVFRYDEEEYDPSPYTEPHPIYARRSRTIPTSYDEAVTAADPERKRLYRENDLGNYQQGHEMWRYDLTLGGHAFSPQDPPSPNTPPDEKGGEWLLLAQDQHHSGYFPEFTVVHFWFILRSDAEEGNFANVKGETFSSPALTSTCDRKVPARLSRVFR